MRYRGIPALHQVTLHYCSALLCLLLSALDTAKAVELIDYRIARHENEFQIKIVALLKASSHLVYKVLTDYENTDRLYPSVTSSQVYRFPCDDQLQLVNHIRSCIAIFCVESQWAVDVTDLSDRRIEMKTIPKVSSFGSGVTIWSLTAVGDDTEVTHQTTLEPGFRVPPFIGNTIISQRLLKEIEVALDRVEYFSRGLQAEELRGRLEKSE